MAASLVIRLEVTCLEVLGEVEAQEDRAEEVSGTMIGKEITSGEEVAVSGRPQAVAIPPVPEPCTQITCVTDALSLDIIFESAQRILRVRSSSKGRTSRMIGHSLTTSKQLASLTPGSSVVDEVATEVAVISEADQVMPPSTEATFQVLATLRDPIRPKINSLVAQSLTNILMLEAGTTHKV